MKTMLKEVTFTYEESFFIFVPKRAKMGLLVPLDSNPFHTYCTATFKRSLIYGICCNSYTCVHKSQAKG
jgi:hypothetical protein